MLNQHEIMQTIQMIDQQHLDVRTITMGISLLSCAHSDVKTSCDKVYDKITKYAENLVATGEAIEKEFGIPIVNKRISVTPIALVAAAAETDSYVPFAQALDRAAKTCGVNFIGGFSALVQKGMTVADRRLIASIPEALSSTDIVCASVNVGSTKAGIDMDAVALMGRTIKALAEKFPLDEHIVRCTDCAIPFFRDCVGEKEMTLWDLNEFAQMMDFALERGEIAKYKALILATGCLDVAQAAELGRQQSMEEYQFQANQGKNGPIACASSWLKKKLGEDAALIPNQGLEKLGHSLMEQGIIADTEYGLIQRTDGQPIYCFYLEPEQGCTMSM